MAVRRPSLSERQLRQLFSVCSWYLEQSLGLLHVLKNYGESGFYLTEKVDICLY